jgi:hypothetical protein
VYEVEHDVHGDAAPGGFGFDGVDLGAVAVDQP